MNLILGYERSLINLSPTQFTLNNNKLSQDLTITANKSGDTSLYIQSNDYGNKNVNISVVQKPGIYLQNLEQDQTLLNQSTLKFQVGIIDYNFTNAKNINISKYDRNVISLSTDSVTINNPEQFKEVQMTAKKVGTTSLTLAADGYNDVNIPITVVAKPVLSLENFSSDTMALGFTTEAKVTISSGSKITTVPVLITPNNKNIEITPSSFNLSDTQRSQNITIKANAIGSSGFSISAENYDTINKNVNVSSAVITSISAGLTTTCATDSIGNGYCAGVNREGQAGANDDNYSEINPVKIKSSYSFKMTKGGRFHSCGITDKGNILCWGYNNDGQMGNGKAFNSSKNLPGLINSSETFKDIACGDSHTCALTNDSSKIFCWGNNARGQLGYGSAGTNTSDLKQVSSSAKFIKIAAGAYHSCAISVDNTAYCWGINSSGQIGNG